MNASAAVAAGTLWHAARLAVSLPVARCDEIQAEFTGLVGRTTRASAGRVAQPTITYAPGDPTSTVLYGIVRDQVETFRARAASLRDGIAGIDGNRGIVESVTYRI